MSIPKVSILMVDDKEENLLTLEAVLSPLGHHLIGLRSGEDALRFILKENIDQLAVILLDVQMQGMDGFETAKLIKSREKAQEIPIIFITALSKSLDHVLYGYHVGSVDYIFKPFNPDILQRKVEAFVTLHGYQQQVKIQGKLLETRTNELEYMVAERTKELLETNHKLRKSQERFEKLFVSSPCLMAIRRLVDLTYVDVNKTWLYLTGYQLEELIGQRKDLFVISVKEVKQSTYDPGENYTNLPIQYTTKNGEEREGLLSVEIMEIDGEMCEFCVIIDITDKVKWEKEMVRLGKLNLIGEMAAGIAHEIRNPMTAVKGFLQLYKKNQFLTTEYIDIMLEELDRADNIITEYLSLSKNKTTFMEPRQLNDVIESLLPLLQADAILAGKHIKTNYGSCPEINLDEKEVRQLILNLAINGLEAMESGKTLTISTFKEDHCVVLKVQDQGKGIDPQYIEKLGTPFFTTKESGTGLGLAVCYSIASRHRAAISVKSSVEGAEINVRFKQSSND